MFQNKEGRKLVIVMTDGADTSSNIYTVESIISKANQNGLAVYTIGIGEAEASVLGSIANGIVVLHFLEHPVN